MMLATGTKVAVGVVAAAFTTAAASPSPSASPSPAHSETTYQVTCDNGETYVAPANTDGTATLNGLPAGTTCSATIVGGGQAAVVLPPVPAGGVATGTFNGPFLQMTPTVGYAGFTTQVIGQGFPPMSTVTLDWNVPGDPSSLAPTDATGRFAVSILVPSGDAAGQRKLRATAVGDPTVKARYLVEPSPFAPVGTSGLELRQ